MNGIKLCLDYKPYSAKPDGTDKPESLELYKRIGKQTHSMKTRQDISHCIKSISECGQSFCPATFTNGWRKAENFEQMQVFVLDFDNKSPDKKIRMSEVYDRTDKYNLPIFFAYETFSSEDCNKFRVAFLNDTPVEDIKAAQMMQNALMTIFPEADEGCKNVVQMYFGGRDLLYVNEFLSTKMPVSKMNIESLFRNMTVCFRHKYGHNHYKERLSKFAKSNGIRLNEKGLLDISMIEEDDVHSDDGDCTEHHGANPTINQDGKFLPKSIIINRRNGEKFPDMKYIINLDDGCTSPCSVGSDDNKKVPNNRTPYRSSVLKDMVGGCRLIREFDDGSRKLPHDELYGIATNLIQVESGISKFKEILTSNPNYNHGIDERLKYWEYNLSLMKQSNYKPARCNNFCPYKDECKHGSNILSTVKPRVGTMEKIDGHELKFYPINVVTDDVRQQIRSAIEDTYIGWRVIKAQTSIGKTTIYLDLIKNSDKRILVAVPTLHLKKEICAKANKIGIRALETPSLNEITEIPEEIRNHIDYLYGTGQHHLVHPYVKKMAEEQEIECLQEYLQEREECQKHKGTVITTHRMLINMDKKRLSEFDVIIVDEDIILKSIISNQVEITLSDLKKILKKARDEALAGNISRIIYNQICMKIKKIEKSAKTESLFKANKITWKDEKSNKKNKEISDPEDNADKSTLIDLPAFCLATHFCFRKASEEPNLVEDTIVFLQPFKFKDAQYIMVSATADETICKHCFGENNVKFHECKLAQYEGVLNQFYTEPMSRDYIDKNAGIVDNVKNWSNFKNTITFKKYCMGNLYFGNSEGSNHMEGQDIDVIGTPHQVDFIYKLFAYTIGVNFDKDAKIKNNLNVTHNGYRFRFTTYEDEALRAIQFWILESELEQAVGRARLLRNSCTVNLFANFPLKQSVMQEFEYDNNRKAKNKKAA